MNVFIMLFFFVVSVIVIIIAGMHGAHRGVARPSTRFALMVIAAMGYVIALPIYTAGWIITEVFF